MQKIHRKIWSLGQTGKNRFLRNTSMEVLKYLISDNSLPRWIKPYFMIIFGLVVFVAVNLAVGIYNIWDSTPVIIGSKCLSLDFSFITFKTWNLFNS